MKKKKIELYPLKPKLNGVVGEFRKKQAQDSVRGSAHSP
jgi:hypothetical protein